MSHTMPRCDTQYAQFNIITFINFICQSQSFKLKQFLVALSRTPSSTVRELLETTWGSWKPSAANCGPLRLFVPLDTFYYLQFIKLYISNILIEKFTINLLQVFLIKRFIININSISWWTNFNSLRTALKSSIFIIH